MKYKGLERFRRLGILLLAMLLLLAEPVAAAVPGPNASITADHMLKLAKTLPPGSVVVTILCDNGNRYLSAGFWEEQ